VFTARYGLDLSLIQVTLVYIAIKFHVYSCH
jgi:hypothetical protein